jgi:hypothetical protein
VLSAGERRPAALVDVGRVRSGGGDGDRVARAERVDTALPRVAHNGGSATYLAQRGRELFERPQELDEWAWAAHVIPGQAPPTSPTEK